MEFEIRNINKLENANISLDGLTVIVGENSSGKSTIGRLLYSTIQAVKNSELKNNEAGYKILMKHIDSLYVHISSLRKDNSVLLEDLFPLPIESFFLKLKEAKNPTEYLDYCKNVLFNMELSPREKALIFNDFQSISITLGNTDRDWAIATEIQYLIESEFENRINSTEKSAFFSLSDKDNVISYYMKDNSLDRFSVSGDSFIQDATYIESPLYLHVLDSLLMSAPYREQLYTGNLRPMIPYHILDFALKMNSLRYVTKDLSGKKNENEIDINSIINGYFEFDKDLNKLIFMQDNKKLEPINVASGIKTFGIIEMLLDADYINENKMLIWDEPENHLHPEWQIKFASLLVSLSKRGIPILITTHSPYFLQAVRYYSSMFGIENFVKYYSPVIGEDNFSTFENVTDNLNKVFSRLANPLNEIMNVDEVRDSKK